MDFGNLLYNVPEELRKLCRKLENVEKKIIKNRWSKTFNNVCLKENIMPTFSRIRHHDPALANTNHTIEYRRYLIRRELKLKEDILTKLTQEREDLNTNINEFHTHIDSKTAIRTALDLILRNSDRVQRSITTKKLNNLYQGQVFYKEHINNFINLSDHQLTILEEEFLNLGLNYHLQPKYDKLHKETELEVLYNNLIDLEKENKIAINPRIVDLLAAESSKHRNTHFVSKVTPQLREAAKSLRNNPNLIIRKADKSSVYVLMNRGDYLNKLNAILSDNTKFQRINRDPTVNLKQKANELISTLNAAQGDIHLNKIIGDFSPGYIYGNVKIHKSNNPLRPIISQVLTPTYHLAKTLNKIITPYIPHQFILKSTNDFIDLLHNSDCNGVIASLDVESLFTNVPIDSTIDIILQHAYNHPTLPPPKIPSEILKAMLALCTKEAPFRSPDGDLYLQIEGVAMGSPLGPTFANFYMGHLEEKVFTENPRPHIYARYVDDIFVQISSHNELIKLKETFQNNSVLKFTFELNINDKLPFLDVMVDTSDSTFHTTVYHKPTDHGTCLNADSECVEKYKNSVVVNYLNRAYRITNNWHDFHTELQQIKQMLVNNNYSNTKIDEITNKFIQQKQKHNENESCKNVIQVYYNNQMHRNYVIEERVLKDIITHNTKPIDPCQKLNIIFYYKNSKCSNLVMRNNLTTKPNTLQQTNVVYSFLCPFPHCKADEYIGLTQTTLSRRLTMHAQAGSIFQHFRNKHNMKPTRKQLVENTTIITKAESRYKLAIKEALLILKRNPTINKQFDNFTNILKLQAHRNHGSNNLTPVLRSNPNDLDIRCPSAPPLTPAHSFEEVDHNLIKNPVIIPSAPPLSQDSTAIGPPIPIPPQTSEPSKAEDDLVVIPSTLQVPVCNSSLNIDSPILVNASINETSLAGDSQTISQHAQGGIRYDKVVYGRDTIGAPVTRELVAGSLSPSFYRLNKQRSAPP